MTEFPLLGLLHPDGVAERALIIGDNCPVALRPASTASQKGSADLVILAPTAVQCGTRAWLRDACRSAADNLAADGVLYVLAPSAWRLRISGLLTRTGLIAATAVIHWPDWDSNRYLLPLLRRPLQYASESLTEEGAWTRRLLSLGLQIPGSLAVLSSVLGSVGMVVRHTRARPLFAWLWQPGSDGTLPGAVIVAPSWRGEAGMMTFHRFGAGDAQPTAVGKLALTPAAACRAEEEAARLARLAADAAQSGAIVPRLLCANRAGPGLLLLQTAVPGRVVARLLPAEPRRLLEIVDRLVAWLVRWHQRTREAQPLTEEVLTAELLGPAALVAPHLRSGAEYLEWLRGRWKQHVGRPVPLVATHNDLTMSNVLVDEYGTLGIVDWEASRDRGLPLVDFFYGVTDATAASSGYVDRLGACRDCFTARGRLAQAVAESQARLLQAAGLPEGLVELCWHACWLHHAANEQRERDDAQPRPFLEIAQWVADRALAGARASRSQS